MGYEEYMTSLIEQIHDKRAKRLVETEIGNHIEEQSEYYQCEGMTAEDAMKEAVRQICIFAVWDLYGRTADILDFESNLFCGYSD